MRVTRFGMKGVVFYVMLVCAFYAAPYLNLFFMLLAFSSVLGVLSIWWAYRNIGGIDGQLDELAPAPAGASQPVTATLAGGPRSHHGLAFEIETGGERYALHDGFDLPAGEAQTIELLTPALPRGVHDIDKTIVRSQYPFGVLEAERTIEGPDTITVYPAPADLAAYRARNATVGQGLGGHDLTEMGPAGLREFKDGDELRHVHWKASARRNELVVKELEGDAAPGSEVRRELRARGEQLEDALSLLSALALECRTNKELFTLHTQEHRGTYGKGHQPFATLLAYLAAVQPLPDNAPPPPAVSPTVLRLPQPTVRAQEVHA